MSVSEIVQNARPRARHVYAVLALALAVLIVRQPIAVWKVAEFVVLSMVQVAPLVIPGVLLAAWITASGAASLKSRPEDGRDRELKAMREKIGEMTMANELLEAKIDRLEAGTPFRLRRLKR